MPKTTNTNYNVTYFRKSDIPKAKKIKKEVPLYSLVVPATDLDDLLKQVEKPGRVIWLASKRGRGRVRKLPSSISVEEAQQAVKDAKAQKAEHEATLKPSEEVPTETEVTPESPVDSVETPVETSEAVPGFKLFTFDGVGVWTKVSFDPSGLTPTSVEDVVLAEPETPATAEDLSVEAERKAADAATIEAARLEQSQQIDALVAKVLAEKESRLQKLKEEFEAIKATQGSETKDLEESVTVIEEFSDVVAFRAGASEILSESLAASEEIPPIELVSQLEAVCFLHVREDIDLQLEIAELTAAKSEDYENSIEDLKYDIFVLQTFQSDRHLLLQDIFPETYSPTPAPAKVPESGTEGVVDFDPDFKLADKPTNTSEAIDYEETFGMHTPKQEDLEETKHGEDTPALGCGDPNCKRCAEELQTTTEPEEDKKGFRFFLFLAVYTTVSLLFCGLNYFYPHSSAFSTGLVILLELAAALSFALLFELVTR